MIRNRRIVEIDKVDRVVNLASYILGVRTDYVCSVYAKRLAKRKKNIYR